VHRLDPRHLPEHRLERLRVAAPEDRHARATALDQRGDRALGDLLPAAAAVRGRLAGPDRQDPVEQHHALVRPAGQVAVLRRHDADVVAQLQVDVDEAPRQRPHVLLHREAEADRVAGRGIGVLAHDEHAHVGEGTPEGVEDVVAGRQVLPPRRQLLAQELTHPLDPVVHRRQRLGPVRRHQPLVDEPRQR
jgi:hypothetical protein